MVIDRWKCRAKVNYLMAMNWLSAPRYNAVFLPIVRATDILYHTDAMLFILYCHCLNRFILTYILHLGMVTDFLLLVLISQQSFLPVYIKISFTPTPSHLFFISNFPIKIQEKKRKKIKWGKLKKKGEKN